MKLGFFDTETGGLNYCGGIALLSIGAVSINTQFEGYVDPNLDKLRIEDEAAKVNGWPHAFAAYEKYTESEIIQAFLEWVKSNQITHLVAHNAPFDAGFLTAAATRSNLWTRRAIPRMLCTQSMAMYAMQLGLFHAPSQSLDAVSKALGVNIDRSKEHSAIEDAILCERVYYALCDLGKPQQQSQQNTVRPVRLAIPRLSR